MKLSGELSACSESGDGKREAEVEEIDDEKEAGGKNEEAVDGEASEEEEGVERAKVAEAGEEKGSGASTDEDKLFCDELLEENAFGEGETADGEKTKGFAFEFSLNVFF